MLGLGDDLAGVMFECDYRIPGSALLTPRTTPIQQVTISADISSGVTGAAAFGRLGREALLIIPRRSGKPALKFAVPELYYRS